VSNISLINIFTAIKHFQSYIRNNAFQLSARFTQRYSSTI